MDTVPGYYGNLRALFRDIMGILWTQFQDIMVILRAVLGYYMGFLRALFQDKMVTLRTKNCRDGE